jgi:hypothetical protein
VSQSESKPGFDAIEQKVRETKELLETIDDAIESGAASDSERLKGARLALRFHAALLLFEAERLNVELPSDGEQLLRRYLGEPPWSFRDIISEMQPDARAVLEKAGE